MCITHQASEIPRRVVETTLNHKVFKGSGELQYSQAICFADLAQLGERLNGIQEVVGSIPIISTKLIKQGKAPCFFIINNQYLSEF